MIFPTQYKICIYVYDYSHACGDTSREDDLPVIKLADSEKFNIFSADALAPCIDRDSLAKWAFHLIQG